MRIILLAGLLSCGAATAQTLVDPPPIIQVVRKPGIRTGMARPYAAAGSTVPAIGMRAVTGLPETWSVEAHYSFASVEELDQRLTAADPIRVNSDQSDPLNDDVLSPSRTMLAIFRPEWSYHPDQAMRDLPKARYFWVSVFRIQPGTESIFTSLIKLRRATAEVVNLDRPELAYQVMSGAPSGTLIFLSPVLTLRTMDNGVAPIPVYAEGLAAAREQERSKLAQTEISRELLLFRIDPRISNVPDDFAAGDPQFWHGR